VFVVVQALQEIAPYERGAAVVAALPDAETCFLI